MEEKQLPKQRLLMAKPNYSGEKRRKDLAKKAKKEEKRLRKLHAKESPEAENTDATDPAVVAEKSSAEE